LIGSANFLLKNDEPFVKNDIGSKIFHLNVVMNFENGGKISNRNSGGISSEDLGLIVLTDLCHEHGILDPVGFGRPILTAVFFP